MGAKRLLTLWVHSQEAEPLAYLDEDALEAIVYPDSSRVRLEVFCIGV